MQCGMDQLLCPALPHTTCPGGFTCGNARADSLRTVAQGCHGSCQRRAHGVHVHSAARVPGYVRWRRQAVIPASLLSTFGTATTFRGWPAASCPSKDIDSRLRRISASMLWLCRVCNMVSKPTQQHCAHQPAQKPLQGQ